MLADMPSSSCRRNVVVSFAAYFMIFGVVVIATAKLWLSWAVAAQAALHPDPQTELYLRSQAKLFAAYRELQRRANLLPEEERQRIADGHGIMEVKAIAISFIVIGVLKTTLSVALMVVVLTELRAALRPWLVLNAFALGATALLVAGAEAFLLHVPPGAVFAMPGSSTPSCMAIVLSISVIVYFVLDVLSMLCVRRFEADLSAQPPALPAASKPV